MEIDPKKPKTIKDVAAQAGVSFKTVSRVLNGEPYVRESTRQKVLNAVAGLDFKVNGAARSLRSKTARRLVLGLNNRSQTYTQAAQINAVLACQAYGFELALQSDLDLKGLEMAKKSGDLVGVLLLPPFCDDHALISELQSAHIPFVRIGADQGDTHGDKIGIDDREAAADMTRYLLSCGHSRIAFVTGDRRYSATQNRIAGYLKALAESDIAPDSALMVEGDFSYASGLKSIETLLSLERPPTAVFASNDEMAAACLAGAYRRGLRVPEHLSVVGFDNAPFSRIISPALTTLDQSIEDMMRRAVSALAERRSAPESPLRNEIIGHKLVIRESSAAPPRQMKSLFPID
jgi:LacI family transcriptional regulator